MLGVYLAFVWIYWLGVLYRNWFIFSKDNKELELVVESVVDRIRFLVVI